MEDRIKTKYMTFVKVKQCKKTSRWHVINNDSGYILGSIFWHYPWRQYVYSSNGCLYDDGCLDTISQFLTQLNNEQRAKVVNTH